MELIDRARLKERLNTLDQALDAPLDLIIVGGAAVVALVEHAEATRDIDLIRTEGYRELSRSPEGRVILDLAEELGLSDRSDSFEVHLPESWKERCRHSPELSGKHISVFVPCPEDLAVMKVFRFNTKDQTDIEKLASLQSFDLQLFRTSFLETLPFAIGDLRHHAQSFMLVWNALVSDDILTIEQVLESAGISSK